MEMYVLNKDDFHAAMEASQSFNRRIASRLFERQ